ncbi:MAG: hypothetical protein LBD91_08460 [Prevotellaceae bacterium]|jgi:hypothetical protein|nr:hypothetical protein [Prevotellaceae bacterium]
MRHYDIYPRGIVIHEAESRTLVRPTGIKGRHVFWLAASGIVYPTRAAAIDDPAAGAVPCTAAARAALQQGERLLANFGNPSVEVRIPDAWEELYGDSFYRVSFIETPYMVAASVKPTQRSSLWISATGRAYANYRHAATDNPAHAIDTATTAGASFPWSGVGLAALAVAGIVYFFISKSKFSLQ